MKNPAEIQALVNAFNNKYQAWQLRQDADFDFWSYKDYKMDAFSKNITFNEPRVLADAVTQTLEASKLSIAIHRKDKRGKLETKAEQFAFSALDAGDIRLVARQSPSLKSSEIFFGAIRGTMAGRWLVYPDPKDKKRLIVDLQPWDPRYLAWEADAEGLLWTGYTTWRNPASIANEYNRKFKAFEDKSGKPLDAIRVIDFWERGDGKAKGRNTVVICSGDELGLSEEAQSLPHGLKSLPVVIVPIGSTPLIAGNWQKYTNLTHWAESIYAGGRPLFNELSRLLTIMMNLAVKSDRPGYYIFTNREGVQVDVPFAADQAVQLDPTDRAEPVRPPESSRTLMELWEILAQAAQRAGFPWLKYGQLWKGQELSRVAIAELKEGADKILTPLLVGLNTFYKTGIQKLYCQYADTDLEWFARGRDSRGKLFQEDIKPGDIDPECDIEIDFVSVTPEEESANYAKAEMAQKAGLASKKFIREQLNKFQDPQGIEQQQLIELAEELDPNLKLLRAIWALDDADKKDDASVLRMQLAATVQQMRMAGLPIAEVLETEIAKLPPPPPMPPMAPPMGAPPEAPPMGGTVPPPGPMGPPAGPPPPATEQEAGQRLAAAMGGP